MRRAAASSVTSNAINAVPRTGHHVLWRGVAYGSPIAKLAAAEKLPAIDPLRAVAKEMQHLAGDMGKLLRTGHPSLDRAARYYVQARGKHIRPLMVLLMARATYSCPRASGVDSLAAAQARQPPDVDKALSPEAVLCDASTRPARDSMRSDPDRPIRRRSGPGRRAL